jgi:hypothetical protein
VIVTRNAWTMPQERWNTDRVLANGVGVVQRSFRRVAIAVQEITERLPEFRVRVAAIEDRAVFALPEILARAIASEAASPVPERALASLA